MSDEKKLMTNSGGMSFDTQKFAFGQRIGLITDSTETSAIDDAITALTQVGGDLSSVLGALFGPNSDSPSAQFGYDRNAKWLAGLAIVYGVLTLEILLVDGQFYGLLIGIGKDESKNGNGNGNGNGKDKLKTKENGNGNGGGGDDDQPFAGLQLEIIYRKISDTLGEWSADLTLPDKFRKFDMGAASVTLPAVGVAVWTNGDFKVSIGWPLGDRSFNISFPPDPIPWAGGGGLYFAKLRSEDSPGNLGVGFNPIIEFGIGLRIGAATEGDFGICSYGASIYLFGTFQGFLAWKDGSSFSSGLSYWWFCASVGITGHLEGSVDFVVISVSVSLDITASVTLALETGHATNAVAEFTATVEASIKIVFFTVHFSFTLDVSVSVTFGSGPVAQITGPTPPESLNMLHEPAQAALTGEISAEVSSVAQPEVELSTPPPPLTLSLVLQPTIRYDVPTQKWVSAGVASLMIDRTAPSTGLEATLGLGTDSFSQMIGSLALYLMVTYGGYTPGATVTSANLQALQIALGGDPGQCGGTAQTPIPSKFDLTAINTWLTTGNISFTITPTDSATTGTATPGAIFPMIPGLVLTYNGQATTFGAAAANQDYLTLLKEYFKQLSLIGDGSINEEALNAIMDTEAESTTTWMPGVIFADYFNILAKQLCRDLCNIPAANQGTLDADLSQVDVGNMAGIVTRFLQHGLRLPDPNEPVGTPFPKMNLLPLFELTGQQFDVAAGPVTTAVLSGTASFPVTIAGGGTAGLPFVLDQAPPSSPIWQQQLLEPINNAQISFILQQGVPWAQTTASATSKWMMFSFPDTLQSQLRLASQSLAPGATALKLGLGATDGTAGPDGQTILTTADGLGGLIIRFSLSQIQQGKGFMTNIFQVKGTDEGTRDLMELLFAAGSLGNFEVDLLVPAASPNTGYTTSIADAAKTQIFKTNLSTNNQPNVGMMKVAMGLMDEDDPSDLGATSALISDPSDFLLLLWECSVVNSGGFYLYVPDTLTFAAGQLQMDVAVVVKSSSTVSPTTPVPLINYQNVILVDSGSYPTGDRVQGAVFQSDGATPVTEPKPNYPAGTLAFGSTWTGAPVSAQAGDTTDYSTVLYQMLEFQVAPGTGITTGSPWSMPLGPNTPPGTAANTWIYKRAVPVYRFVDNAANPPNRYGAIGLEVNLNLQLVDIFGNAFGLNQLQGMPVYNDPLIPVDQWPGTYLLYTFTAGTGGQATLQLTASFVPSQITQKETSLAYYQIIYDQLTDPRTSMSVTTALAAAPVTLATSTGTATQAALSAFVAEIIAYLTAGSTSQPPTCVFLSGNVAIDYVTQIDEDLFPLWVSLTTTRNAPAGSPTDYPDGFLSVVSQVSPLLNPNATSTLCPDPTVTPSSTALRNWTIGFESAFNNFDGSNGLLKVLVGTPPEKVTMTKSKLGTSAAGDVTSVPGDLWAMKWGADNGVTVTFGNALNNTQPPVYFAPLPLSTTLISTDVQMNSYDSSTGVKSADTTTQTFSGVDMDGLGSSFLKAFDSLLSPDLANAMAQLNPTQYNKLMTAKEDLAFAISSSITWVLQEQMPVNGTPGAGELSSAQEQFRENLLASLGSDFGTSVIIQLPGTVTVKNQFETDDPSSRPPEFFGNPTPTSALKQYTVSTTALPVAAGTGYLNFLLGAIDPTIASELNLTFNYDINFLDYQFQTSQEQFGYIPSSWLRFVVPDVDPTTGSKTPVLDVPMGSLDIPIPLRAYPSPPRLVTQNATSTYPSATNPPPTTIAQALQYDYNLTVGRPQVAQDDLHMNIEFNGSDLSTGPLNGTGGALFPGLANFQAFQQQFLTGAAPIATTAILTGASSAENWLDDIVDLVQGVAGAWGQPAVASELAAPGDSTTPPLPFTWDFTLQVKDEHAPNVLTLTWTPNSTYTGAPVWPVINGAVGTGTGNTMTYTLQQGDKNLDQPTLTWTGLSVITNQSVSTEAWIERNETLASGEATNPAFIYSTAHVTFASPVIPLLEVPGKITIPTANSDTMPDAVSYVVNQVMQPGPPFAQVGWGLEADYTFILVSGNGGQQLQTTLPVFLVKTPVSTDTGTLPPGVQAPATLITDLEGALNSWYKDFQPSTTNASLLFDITIFAVNSQQPLARLMDIEAGITGGSDWWKLP
jgi:hypothetical protein